MRHGTRHIEPRMTAIVDALAIRPAVTPGTQSAVQSDAIRTANAAAMNIAIVAAQAAGSTVLLTQGFWSDASISGNNAFVRIEGTGFHVFIGTIDTSGTLLDLKVASGQAASIVTNVKLFGPCEYIPTNEYDGGTIPTTYTTVMLEIGCSTTSIQDWRVENMHILGGYDGLKLTNASMTLIRGNKIQHQRRAPVAIDNPASSDSGDTIITENWLHCANAGSPGYDAAVTCALQVDACSGLYVTENKVYSRTDTSFNVNIAHATYDDATAPQIKLVFEDNRFDSGGLVAGSQCIKIRSAWGSGGTGTAVTGNRISGLVVSGNIGHNCVELLDLSSYSGGITNIDIADNVMIGGGGITLGGTIDRIRIADNAFDNGSWTGSYGPAKPITSTATITNGRYYDNRWLGFSSAADLTDESGTDTTDTHPDLVTLTPVAGVVTVEDHGATNVRGIQEVTITENSVVTVPDTLPHGARIRLYVKHSGATWTLGAGTAPTGYDIVASGSVSAGVDDRVDVVDIDCVWTSDPVKKIVDMTLREGAAVTGLTTEGGGGGFSPDDLGADLLYWGEADSLAYSDEASVTTWDNLATGGSSVTLTHVGATAPIFDTTQINSLAAIRFEGANRLTFSSLGSPSALEAFVVWKKAGSDPGDGSSAEPWCITGDSGNATVYPFSDGNVYDNFGTTARKSTGNPSQALTSFHVYNVLSKSGEWTSRINGTQHYTTATNTFGIGGSVTPRIGSGIADFFTGHIACLILVDRELTSGERGDMLAYLQTKYGL